MPVCLTWAAWAHNVSSGCRYGAAHVFIIQVEYHWAHNETMRIVCCVDFISNQNNFKKSANALMVKLIKWSDLTWAHRDPIVSRMLTIGYFKLLTLGNLCRYGNQYSLQKQYRRFLHYRSWNKICNNSPFQRYIPLADTSNRTFFKA